MGWTPRRRQLTGCRRRQPLRKATSCGRGMHLSHAEVGFRDFIQSLFAVTCYSSRSAMQAILPILALSLYFTDGGDDNDNGGDGGDTRRRAALRDAGERLRQEAVARHQFAAVALAGAIPALRPGATIMQLGLGGDMTLPVQAMTAKELSLKGSFRFHEEFHTGVSLMQKGLIDVKPFITHSFALDQAEEAFQTAGNREKAVKAQIVFATA